MIKGYVESVLRHLGARQASDLNDGDLLVRFARTQDETAFAALVERYGHLVMGVCRRVLADAHDAEDAFQATFLVLARKASSLDRSRPLGNWLYTVAYRLALRTRASAARRRECEQVAPLGPAGGAMREPAADAEKRELYRVLDEELSRLPERHRLPLVLCYLEGRTHEEAARALGLPRGSVAKRLAGAEERLRRRLLGRGLTMSAGAMAVIASESAAVSAPIAQATVRAATAFAGGKTAAGTSASAVALAEGMLQTMGVAKMKTAAAIILVLGIVGTGAGMLVRGSARPGQDNALVRAEERPGDAQPGPVMELSRDPLPPGAVARLGTVRFRHGRDITGAVFTRDGKALVSGGLDGKVRVWDWESGKERRVLDVGMNVVALARGQGQTVLVGEGWGTKAQVRRWDLKSGKPLNAVYQGTAHFVASADGKLAAVQDEREIRVLDTATGRERCRVPLEPWPAMRTRPPTRPVTFSPDGTLLGASSPTGDVVFYTTAEGKLQKRLKVADQGVVIGALTFSPDGKLLAAGLGDASVRLIEVAEGNVRSGLLGHEVPRNQLRIAPPLYYGVRSLTFSPDGTKLASIAFDHLICVWDWAAGKARRRIQSASEFVAFTPDSKIVAGGSGGYLPLPSGRTALRFWETDSGKECRRLGEVDVPLTLAFAPDGKRLAVQGLLHFQLWDPTADKPLTTPEAAIGCGGPVFSHGGKHLLWVKDYWKVLDAASMYPEYQEVVRWDLAGNRPLMRLKIEGVQPQRHPDAIPGQPRGFSDDGEILAVQSMGPSKSVQSPNPLLLIDTQTGKERGRLEGGTDGLCYFSPDNFLVASAGGYSKVITLWETVSGRKVQTIQRPRIVRQLTFSPDGRTLACWEFDTQVRGGSRLDAPPGGDSTVTIPRIVLLDVLTGRELHQLDDRVEVRSRGGSAMAFSPDGRLLALGYPEDTAVYVWDVYAGKRLGKLEGHRGPIRALAFAPDGKRLASGSEDTTVLLWDMSGLRPTARSPEAGKLSAEQAAVLWQDLAGDPPAAYQAVGKLAAAPADTVALLKERLRPVPPVAVQRLEQWIRELDSKEFAVRQKATEELRKRGREAEPLLRGALAARPPLEMRTRLEQLLAGVVGHGLPPETMRALRCVALLERIATPDARAVLAVIAKGPPRTWEMEEANRALTRLAARGR